ncbi:hypothetical protein MSG28_009922 [Choristoneura fumiferana]|uniref:Uncharacterized protein n=1 Tax=Choristoneura fumiferana TaxID=7141 RepID=A0ACC0JD47_CHOFU|nr:hypothetical protein MSG28_009922 [Choristoneura fumiferana]
MENIQVITQDFLNMHITKSDAETAAPIERRFKKGITVAEFKLYDTKNKYICDIDNDDALLGSYPIDDLMRIHVIDKFTLLSDVGSSDSAERSFLQRNRLGKYNEEEMMKIKEQQQKELEEEARLAASVLVGARCEVRVPHAPARRATVRDEKAVLTELVIKYRTVIENKKSDATTNAEKVNGWKLLSDEFNAISTYCKRAPESLKTCWENIKRQTKKESASRKREMFKTGGGRPPPPPPSTGAGCMIETILGPALEGLENPYDGDAFLDINDKENVATQSTTNECPQINSDTEFLNNENEVMHVIEIMENSEPLCTQSQSPIAGPRK